MSTTTVVTKDTEKSAPTSVTPVREPSAPRVKTIHIETSDEAFAAMSLPELERTASLARVRYLYACDLRQYWESEEYWRSFEFNRAIQMYEQRKDGFTNEQIMAPSKRGELYRES